jgi:hypothetical protein
MQHFLTFAERWTGLLRYAARFSPSCHRISAGILPRKKAVYRDVSDAAGRPRATRTGYFMKPCPRFGAAPFFDLIRQLEVSQPNTGPPAALGGIQERRNEVRRWI